MITVYFLFQEMAKRHGDFVFGFIGQKRLAVDDLHMVYMTPGVKITEDGDKDSLGQQYRSVCYSLGQ